MRKVIWIGILVVVLAIAGAVYYAFSNLDRFAKKVIEEAGSQALGVAVKVDSVNIQLTQRQATITGLTVANPPGYSSRPAISFGRITVQVADASGNIKKIVAVNPVIRVELKGALNNLSQIQRRAQRAAGRPGSAPSASPDKGRVYSIGLLKVEGAQAILTGPDLKQPVELGVRSLQMRNLKGTSQQIAGQVFSRLLGMTMEKAASVAVQRGLGKVINKESGYGQEITNFLQKLGGAKK
jgi:hypothetical protein